MATYNKDFVVKNGLVVTEGGTFGAAITIGAPTANDHAATKSYVDDLVSSIGGGGGNASVTVGDTAPSTPEDGNLWLDTTIDRLKIYYAGTWIVIATYDDSLSVTQHIHDTSIDGTGLVIDTFTESPAVSETPVLYIDGGSAGTTTFDTVLDGGNV